MKVTQATVTNIANKAQAQAFLPSCLARVNRPASKESSDLTAIEEGKGYFTLHWMQIDKLNRERDLPFLFNKIVIRTRFPH